MQCDFARALPRRSPPALSCARCCHPPCSPAVAGQHARTLYIGQCRTALSLLCARLRQHTSMHAFLCSAASTLYFILCPSFFNVLLACMQSCARRRRAAARRQPLGWPLQARPRLRSVRVMMPCGGHKEKMLWDGGFERDLDCGSCGGSNVVRLAIHGWKGAHPLRCGGSLTQRSWLALGSCLPSCGKP